MCAVCKLANEWQLCGSNGTTMSRFCGLIWTDFCDCSHLPVYWALFLLSSYFFSGLLIVLLFCIYFSFCFCFFLYFCFCLFLINVICNVFRRNHVRLSCLKLLMYLNEPRILIIHGFRPKILLLYVSGCAPQTGEKGAKASDSREATRFQTCWCFCLSIVST